MPSKQEVPGSNPDRGRNFNSMPLSYSIRFKFQDRRSLPPARYKLRHSTLSEKPFTTVLNSCCWISGLYGRGRRILSTPDDSSRAALDIFRGVSSSGEFYRLYNLEDSTATTTLTVFTLTSSCTYHHTVTSPSLRYQELIFQIHCYKKWLF